MQQLPETQPTTGSPHQESPNPKTQGSRDREDGQLLQDHTGYPHTADGPNKEAGADTDYVYEARGYVNNEKARALPTTHVNDHVRKGT